MIENKNTIKGEDAKYYHEAVADIVLWLDGYCAGKPNGASHLRRVNMDGLRDLKNKLQQMDWNHD